MMIFMGHHSDILFFVCIAIVFATSAGFVARDEYAASWPFFGLSGILVGFILVVYFNPTYQKISNEDAAISAQQLADYNKLRHTPQLFSTGSDGCDVYQFEGNDGNTHYFTKCPNSTTITTNTIREGKHTRQEDITTQ